MAAPPPLAAHSIAAYAAGAAGGAGGGPERSALSYT